jgi:integrase
MPEKAHNTRVSPRKNLTEEGVARYRPPTDRQFANHYDAICPGLILRHSSKNRKTWVVQIYKRSVDASGKRKRVPSTKILGLYPHLSVKQAREKARKFYGNPEAAAAENDESSFEQVSGNFLKWHFARNKDEHGRVVPLRSEALIERIVERLLLPHWGGRAFRAIRRGDVVQLLDKIEAKNGARLAEHCRSIFGLMCAWYTERNDDYVPASIGVRRRYNAGARRRKRILDDDEIRALWAACDANGTLGALCKMLLLTAQRRDKVVTMKWDDISADGVWSIPAEPREKTNAGSLQLPPLALEILKAQPRVAGNPFVFFGLHGRFNNFHKGKKQLDAKMPKGSERWVLHDLRRTARSLMSRAGVRPDLAERALGHALKGVESIYDRYNYSAEKGAALAALATLVASIVDPPSASNVVPLHQ